MSSEVQGVRGWLLHLYPELRQKSAVLKLGYALRSGVGVGLFAICHAILQHESDRQGGSSTLLQWSQGCLWGAITVLIVNFPIMGRIAKQSFERGLGTIIGGWLGYTAYIVLQHPSVEAWAECWMAIISFVFAIAAVLVGVKLKLDYSAKLLGISFLLVLWTPQTEEQALDVAASRISCIVIAVVIMAALAVIIYPQIASELVMGELHSGMQSIADFNRIVWDEVNQTCKEESDRISQSFHLQNGVQEITTDVEAMKICTGHSLDKSPHDSISTADAQLSACMARLASAENALQQQSSLSAVTQPQDLKALSCKGDCGLASQNKDILGPGTRVQEDLNSTSLPQPLQGDSFIRRWQRHQQQNHMQDAANEEAIHAHLDDVEQSTDREAALAQPFKAYFELDKERPFFDALGDFRSHIARCEEHVTTALSEVYVGTWAGRRWFFPTVFYQNTWRQKKAGWHIPEQVLKRVRMRMQRTVRVLYMIHCTFRDGFQGEVLEELQHHYPLDLLMTLSNAAVGAMQDFVDCFPRAHVSPRRLMPAEALIKLNEVTNELLELARASRANKVDLIMMGERYRKMLESGIDPVQQAQMERNASCFVNDALPGMRVISEKLRVAHSSSGSDQQELFLFPNTDAGWLATTRWYSFHFLVQQLVGALVRLRISLNLALPLLPGAEIDEEPRSLEGTYHKDCKEGGQSGLADSVVGKRKVPAAVQVAVE